MFVNVPYFRYRKEVSIYQPSVSFSFQEAIERAQEYLIENGTDKSDVSVYFHSSIPASENCPNLSDHYGIESISELDSTTCIDIEDAICEVVKGNGYCCRSVIIYYVKEDE